MASLYKVKGKVWLWPGTGAAWHFVHVDKRTSEKIVKKHGANKRGFGSFPVLAKVGKTEWNTSIFPDKQSGTYLLPLKAKVRYEEGIEAGESIQFILHIS